MISGMTRKDSIRQLSHTFNPLHIQCHFSLVSALFDLFASFALLTLLPRKWLAENVLALHVAGSVTPPRLSERSLWSSMYNAADM